MPNNSSAIGSAGWLILIALVIGLPLCYFGVFYETGAQFYQSCWEKAHAIDSEPSSPEQAARWAQCERAAEPALFADGFIFAGAPEYAVTPQLRAIQLACPSRGQIPLTGAWYLAVGIIQNSGGPTLSDRFLPASSAIVRAFQSRWPNCAATAAANGFPRMVVTPKGEWEYQTTCLPCKPEDEAIEKDRQAQREWDKKSAAEKERIQDQWLEDAAAAEQQKHK
jgi:hypothetical protein